MSKRNFLFIPLFSFLAIAGCTKDRTPDGIDAELFTKAQKVDGFVYYNNIPDFLETPNETEHKSKYFRTKYNYEAASILDEIDFLVTPGSVFPEGSLIVNEMSSITGGQPEKLAIMFKDSKNPFADKNGWVWSYLNADNTVIEPASRMGVSCIACHSKPGNTDMTLMSNYFSGVKSN